MALKFIAASLIALSLPTLANAQELAGGEMPNIQRLSNTDRGCTTATQSETTQHGVRVTRSTRTACTTRAETPGTTNNVNVSTNVNVRVQQPAARYYTRRISTDPYVLGAPRPRRY